MELYLQKPPNALWYTGTDNEIQSSNIKNGHIKSNEVRDFKKSGPKETTIHILTEMQSSMIIALKGPAYMRHALQSVLCVCADQTMNVE